MDIRSCKNCGKIFQAQKGVCTCPDCLREEDRKFTVVRNYMFENPSVGITDICKECDVDEDVVMRWLREGRLISRDANAVALKCLKCGAPIMGGTYCQKCSDQFADQLGSAARDMQRTVDRMNERPSGPLGFGGQDIRRR